MFENPVLPIDEIRAPLESALTQFQQFIIHAPPGAGKSTRIPLWLLDHSLFEGKKILLIQPRRLAASNVAGFLAKQLGEKVGGQVGLRTRFETKVSSSTRIEVITEGLFIRLIQADPELQTVAVVIFDEFHERSVSIDLGLALALEAQTIYRDASAPLHLLVMSATLAADQLTELLDNACSLRSEGYCYPVETFYTPLVFEQQHRHRDLSQAISRLIRELLLTEEGSFLVFLPGIREINSVALGLKDKLDELNVAVYPLHSALPDDQQRAAISAVESGLRKVVLTTNIAETSVTIDGIRVVIDSGLAKALQFDSRRGMPQLITETISKAAADQRRGRAGRTAPGRCYRLWSEAYHASLYEYPIPEIKRTDLMPFMLELAQWGDTDINQYRLIDCPSSSSVAAARQVLTDLEAVDSRGVITDKGQIMVRLGLHPRLAVICLEGERQKTLSLACLLAAMLSEPNLLKQSRQVDLLLTMEALANFIRQRHVNGFSQSAARRIVTLAQQLMRRVDSKAVFKLDKNLDYAVLASLMIKAFPDRLANLRENAAGRYLLMNSQLLQLHPDDHLNGQPWLLVTDFGSAKPGGGLAYIHQALAIDANTMETVIKQRSTVLERVEWQEQQAAFLAKQRRMLGAIVVSEQSFQPSEAQRTAAVLAYIKQKGLTCLSDLSYREFAARLLWVSQATHLSVPDISESSLMATLDEWLSPYLAEVKTQADLKRINIKSLLTGQLDWNLQQQLATLAPEFFVLPTGEQRQIEYGRLHKPVIAVKIQALYGLQQTPAINRGASPLLIELLSPAGRPLQLTDDLMNFWSNTYHDVAKEMRGRYPKHYWPEQPALAQATTKTKKWMAVPDR